MRIGLVSIFVDDQDHAERFYTQVLGFKVDDTCGNLINLHQD